MVDRFNLRTLRSDTGVGTSGDVTVRGVTHLTSVF